jgi:hypothetical protein
MAIEREDRQLEIAAMPVFISLLMVLPRRFYTLVKPFAPTYAGKAIAFWDIVGDRYGLQISTLWKDNPLSGRKGRHKNRQSIR